MEAVRRDRQGGGGGGGRETERTGWRASRTRTGSRKVHIQRRAQQRLAEHSQVGLVRVKVDLERRIRNGLHIICIRWEGNRPAHIGLFRNLSNPQFTSLFG